MMPGRGDFAFGRAFVESVGKEFELPYVISNVECITPLPWPATRSFERNGVKIVVYGIANPSLELVGCRVTDPGALLETVRADDTVVIVLSDLDKGRDADLAKRATGVDFMVRSDSIEGLVTPTPMANGGLILSSGSRGRQLGLLEVELTPGALGWRDEGEGAARASDVDAATAKLKELATRKAAATDTKSVERLTRQEEFWTKKQADARAALELATAAPGSKGRVRNELRGLGVDAGEHAPTLERVSAFKAANTGSAPSAAGAVSSPMGEGGVGVGPFAGSAACTACHAPQAKQWASTGHARAYAALVADQRQFDLDCFGCHVTGAKDANGPQDPRALHGLENVGCESCHGAGRDHAASPTTAHLVASPPTSQCVQCHDSRQDGGRFEEAAYRARVTH
ncbi:hypothetical protein LBMAG42_04130 [Deltaproteobacteria bacterium]|nr:hypothetical protein LBMAG42_04130 [Deltaproteobacteria bacterium]